MPVLPSRLPSRFPLSNSLLPLCTGFMVALALSSTALPAARCQTPSIPAATQTTPQTTVTPAARPTTPTPANAPQGKGAHEGIKVNGYWKIDVRNPDGTLDKHVEFENSLTTNDPYADSGDYALATTLAGGEQMGDPGIGINISPDGFNLFDIKIPGNSTLETVYLPDFSGPGPCGGIGCILSTPNSLLYSDCLQPSTLQVNSAHNYETNDLVGTPSKASCSSTLSVSNNSNYPLTQVQGKALLQLQGNFTATTAGNVTNVASIVTLCQSADTTHASCTVPSGTAPGSFTHFFIVAPITFTMYTLPTPLPVGVGQVVNLSVSLTFN